GLPAPPSRPTARTRPANASPSWPRTGPRSAPRIRPGSAAWCTRWRGCRRRGGARSPVPVLGWKSAWSVSGDSRPGRRRAEKLSLRGLELVAGHRARLHELPQLRELVADPVLWRLDGRRCRCGGLRAGLPVADDVGDAGAVRVDDLLDLGLVAGGVHRQRALAESAAPLHGGDFLDGEVLGGLVHPAVAEKQQAAVGERDQPEPASVEAPG